LVLALAIAVEKRFARPWLHRRPGPGGWQPLRTSI